MRRLILRAPLLFPWRCALAQRLDHVCVRCPVDGEHVESTHARACRLHAGPRVSHAPALRRRKIEEPSNFSAFVALTHANSDSIDGFHHATHVQMWDGICCAATGAMQPLSIGLVVEFDRNGRRHQRRDQAGQ